MGHLPSEQISPRRVQQHICDHIAKPDGWGDERDPRHALPVGVVLKRGPWKNQQQDQSSPEPEPPTAAIHGTNSLRSDFLRKQSVKRLSDCTFARGFAGVWTGSSRCDVCSTPQRRFSLPNKLIPMTATYRSGRSALDEFLPELDGCHENAHARVDPRNIQLDSVLAPAPVVAVEFPPTSQETLRLPVTANESRVQWWPMFAAALIGIGVSLLALGALARFGQL